ncbi:unnamed protein product [Lymnaea stagnalis]|uniref:Golgin subfamily B member 1 n=1 Tax=Lymnaea stagnalis TaxID=6523 RepID=A0AAV2IFM9_LYMST
MAGTDAEMELEQNQLQIQHLKALVRDRDEALQNKEKELQETNAKMSKLRLQAKAKAAKKTQLSEVKKAQEGHEKESFEEGASQEDGAHQANRAKALLLKRKLDEKDRIIAEKEEVIRVRESQLEAKERVLAERDGFVADLNDQLEQKTRAMENMQKSSGGSNSGDEVSQMYAQMVYKDRKIIELNNKILDQDKRIMDLQEFAGEKDQVIRGRDKVIEVLQNSIKERDQTVQDQALLISKLTARVESTNEKVDDVSEQLRQKSQELKTETERFHIKLTESQKYFEEMLQDMDTETKRLRVVIEEKSKDLSLRENDLIQQISKHERDIEALMNKDNINLQDHALQLLENKLKDTNDVLDGKLKVISVLQKENADKDKELSDSRDTQRLLKEKLQMSSEQMMILQASFVDMETQWKDEKLRLENKLKDTVEKHETELSEKELQLQTLQSTLAQYQTAYTQASIQYGRLQEHYQQALAGHVDPEHVKEMSAAASKDKNPDIDRLKKQLEEATLTIDKLSAQVKELETNPRVTSQQTADEGGAKSDTKLLKVKAQMTNKIKALEKQLQELKENKQPADEVASLKSRIKELEDEKRDFEEKLVEFNEKSSTIVELRAQIEELQGVVDMVHDQKETLQKEIDALKQENTQLTQTVTDLQAILDSAEGSQMQELQDAKTALRNSEIDKHSLQKEIEELKQRVDDYEQHKEETLANLKEQAEKLIALAAESKNLHAELEVKTARLSELERDKALYDIKLSEIEQEKQGLEQDKAELLQELRAAREKADHEKQSTSELESETGDLKVKISELTAALSGEQNISKEQKEQINELFSKLTALELQLQESVSNLEKVKEELSSAEQERVAINAELQSCSTKADILQQEKEKILAEKVNLEADRASLQSDLAVVRSELLATSQQTASLKTELLSEIDNLRSQLENQAKDLSDKSSSLEKFMADLTAANEELRSLKVSLEQSGDRCKEFELQVKQLKRELDVAREGQSEKGKELEEKTTSLLNQLSELESELASQQKLSSTQQATISELSFHLDERKDEVALVNQQMEELKHSLQHSQLTVIEKDKEAQTLKDSVEVETNSKLRLEESLDQISQKCNYFTEALSEKAAYIKQIEEDKIRTIESLNISLVSVQTELTSAHDNISHLQSVIESKETELMVLKQNCDSLQQQILTLSSDLDSSTSKLLEFKSINESLQQQVASYNEKITTMSCSIDEDSQQTQEIIQKLQDEKASSHQQVMSLEAEVAAARNACADKDSQLVLLNAALSEQEKRADSLQTALQKVQADKSHLDQQVSTLEQNILDISNQAQSYATAAEEAQGKLQALEEDKKVKESRFLQLITALSDSESGMRQLESTLNFGAEENSELEIQVNKLQTQFKLEKELKESLEIRLATIQTQLEAEQESKITLEKLLTESEDHKKSIEHKVTHLEMNNLENLEKLAELSEDYEAQITSLKEQLTLADSERMELKHNVERVKAQAEMSSMLVEKLQSSSSDKEQETIQQLMAKTEEVTQLQQQLELISIERDELKAKIVSAEQNVSHLQDELHNSRNLQDTLTSSKQSLEAELASKISELQQLREEAESFTAVQEILAQRTKELQDQSEEVSNLQQQISSLQVDVAKLQILEEQVTNLQSQNERLSGLLHNNNDDVTALQSRFLELEEEKLSLSSRLKEMEEIHEAVVTRSETLSIENNRLLKELQNVSENCTSIAHESTELKRAIADNEITIQSKLSEAQDFMSALIERESQLAEKDSALQEKCKELETLGSTRDKLLEEIQTFSASIAGKDQKIHSLLENMQEMEARLVQLEEQQASQSETEKQQQILQGQGDLETLKTALAEKEKAYADKELMAKKALATAKKLKFQLTQANSSLEEAKVEITKLNSEKLTLETQLSSHSADTSGIISDQSQSVLDVTLVESTEISTGISGDTSLNLTSESTEGKVSLELQSLQLQIATYKECCNQLQEQVQTLTEAAFDNESKLKKKQNEIDQLEGVKEGLKLTVIEVESAYEKLQQEMEAAQEDFLTSKEAMEKKCVILEEQAQQWKSFVENLQQEMTAKDHRIQQMNEELHTLHSDHKETTQLKMALEEKEENIMEMMAKIEHLQETLTRESQNTEELGQVLKAAEETIANQNTYRDEQERTPVSQSLQSLSHLQGFIDEKDSEIKELRECLLKQKADFELREQSLLSQITGLDRQIEEHKNQFVEMTDHLDEAQRTKEEMWAHAESLRQQMREQGVQIAELNSMVDSLRLQVEESHGLQQTSSDDELKSLQSALAGFQQQVEDQRLIISQMEQKIGQELVDDQAVTTDALMVPSEPAVDLSVKLESYQQIVEELNQEILSLRKDKENIVQECSEVDFEDLKRRLESISLEKASLEEERDQLRLDLDGQLDIAKRMQDVVTDKLGQVQNLQAAYEKLQSHMEALSSEKEQHLTVIDTLRGEIEGLEQVIAENQFAEAAAKSDLNKVQAERDQLIVEVENLKKESENLRQKLEHWQETNTSFSDMSFNTSLAEEQKQWSRSVAVGKAETVSESLQKSADGSPSKEQPTEQKLKQTEASLQQLQVQYEKTKSRLQVTEVKCEKMLVKLKAFKDKNDKLQIQVDELQQKLGLQGDSPQRDSNLREERRRLEEQVISLGNKLRQTETYNGQLIYENSSLKDQLKEIGAQSGGKKMALRLSEVQAQLEGKVVELDQSRAQQQVLQKTVEDLKAEVIIRTEENQSLKLELVHKSQTESDELSSENSLQLMLTEKCKQVDELEQKLGEEIQAKGALAQEVTRLEKELEKSLQEAEKLAKRRKKMKLDLQRQQEETDIKSLQSVFLTRDKEALARNIDTLRAELSELKGEISRLNEELDSERTKSSLAQKEVTEMKSRLSEEKAEWDVSHREQTALQESKITSLTVQLQTLQSQYDSLSSDNADYQSLATTLTANSTTLKREVEELKFKLKKTGETSTKSSGEGAGQDLSELTQLLGEAEQERDELREEFEGVREELIVLRRDKMSLSQQVVELSTTVQQLKEKISGLESAKSSESKISQGESVKVERVVPLGKDKAASRAEEIASLEEELTELREELATALDVNKDLKIEVSGLNWKLEEASNLEQDVEDLQAELSSSTMEKKILFHDLEEVRGEMSALQTDKHLLMKEVERLSELLEGQIYLGKGSGDGKPARVQRSTSEEVLQVLATKDSEISEIQRILDDKTKEVISCLTEIDSKDAIIIEHEKHISALEEDLNQAERALENMKDLEQRISLVTEELENSQSENKVLIKRLENFNVKIDTVKSLEADFDSLNADFNNVLEEKRDMARQIEDLHVRIRDLVSHQHEVTFSVEQQQHVLREKETLQRRVAELEGTEGNSMEENARLKQELDKIVAVLQQAEFDKESLTSQLQLYMTGGSSGSQEEYMRLQAQFSDVMEQKNAVVTQLNEALHTLKQREARCQQLALQVSQLAEDRGYLNTQLANLSKSLREKEQEWIAIRQQYGDLYQAYIASQSKTAELERRIALDSVQKELDEEETAAEADQVRSQNDQELNRLVELQSLYQNLQDTYTALNTTLTRERTLREQLERELGEAQEQIKLLAACASREIYLQMEEDNDSRIRETSTMLTRHGFGYCSRIHSWLRVKKAYFSFSSRQLGRVMRLRPGLRTIIWIYFAFIHILLIACFGGFLR